MKRGVLAIDPAHDEQRAIGNICSGLVRLQAEGWFTELHLVSILHPDTLPMPNRIFGEEKEKLGEQLEDEVLRKLDPKLRVDSSTMLITEERSMSAHIRTLHGFARDTQAEGLVVGTSGRSALAYLLQGSFAEEASLTSDLPVMVFGRGAGRAQNGRVRTVMVAFNPLQPPSYETRQRILRIALGFKAGLMLLPFDEEGRWPFGARPRDPEAVEHLRRDFAKEGVIAVHTHVREQVLPAQIPVIADQEQAWLTIVCATPALMKKPLFGPSPLGQVMADMFRPLIVMKDLTHGFDAESLAQEKKQSHSL